ncbi:IS3 family transposase [Kitasatospora sp. NPDC058397]|uniref:IS3 family transposase n=1 Tax=unclassified Kitasatospora TaxID=2633591 RepID=UPI00365DB0B3
MTVHPFIEAEKQVGHNVKRACELLQVSRVAFYARRTETPGPRAVRDAELTEKITKVHETSRGTYGAPRVHAALHRQGTTCRRRRVARLMRQAGLEGWHRRRRQRTTIPDPHAATRPDLVLRDFQPHPAALDARWCGDITYIPTDEGWLYLATVIDIASRRVVVGHRRPPAHQTGRRRPTGRLPHSPPDWSGDLPLRSRLPIHQP